MKVKFITVDEDCEMQRIDNYLVRHYKNVPKSHIYKIIRKGEVRVNKKRIKPSYKLVAGDQIRIPPIKDATKDENANRNREGKKILVGEKAAVNKSKLIDKVSTRFTKIILNNILYEDKYMMIINKPSGLAVHGGSGLNGGLIEILRYIRPKDTYLELVHRLDRDTSGCIIIAKKRSMLRELHALLRENKIKKYYEALVVGKLASQKLTIDVPLKRNVLKSGERIVKVDHESGQQSLTKFKTLKTFKNCSLVEASLITGRTHQIRVHAVYNKTPVIGDDKYGDKNVNIWAKELGLNRMFLHAKKLKFKCPKTEKIIVVEAENDENLTSFLQKLQDFNF